MKENSTEEDMRILERIDVKYFMSAKIEQSDYMIDKADEVNNAIEHILSDYKRVLKENEEVKRLHIQDNKHLDFIIEHSIPVQKVKDKIEEEIKYHEKNILDIENITMLKGKTAKEEAEIEFNKYAIVVLKKMLQELLEGRK